MFHTTSAVSVPPDRPVSSVSRSKQPVLVLRPEHQRLLGNRNAALLLNQIQFLYTSVNKRRPFYKFKLPCASHPAYKSGDSWSEVVGFSRTEFDTALSKIGTKICRGVSRRLLEQTRVPIRAADESDDVYTARFQAALKCLVLYWTDDQRRTWYQLNERLLDEFLHLLYLDKATSPRFSAKAQQTPYSSNAEPPRLIQTPDHDVTPLSESNSFSSEKDTEDPSESDDSESRFILDQAEPLQSAADNHTNISMPVPAHQTVYTLYAEQIGKPDRSVCQQLDALVRQYGADNVEKAIAQAGQYGAKHVSYITKVLQNRAQQRHRAHVPVQEPKITLGQRWWEIELPPPNIAPIAPSIPLETFPEHVQKAWTTALVQLKADLNAGSVKEALPPMRLITYEVNTPSRWTIELPTAHLRDQCAYRFTRRLTNLLGFLSNEEVQLEFVKTR
jgi:hypothetical protein